MDNYERTTELIEVASEASGKAEQQFVKYQDTVEFRLNQLKNSWEQLRTSFLNSEVYKDVLVFLDNLVNKLGDLSGINFAGFAIMWFTLGKTAISQFAKGMRDASSTVLGAFTTLRNTIMKKVSQTKLGSFLGINTNLNLSTQEIEAQIQAVNNKIIEARNLIGTPMTMAIDTTRPIADIRKVSVEYTALSQKLQSLNKSQDYVNNHLARFLAKRGYTPESYESALGSYSKDLSKDLVKKANYSAMGVAVGTSFSMGLTSAITSYVLRNNPGQVLKDTILTGLVSSVPQIVNTFKTVLDASSSKLTALFSSLKAGGVAMGISLAIGALAAGIKAASNAIKEMQIGKLNRQINQLNKEIEDLTSKKNELDNLIKTEKEAIEKAEELKKEFNELNSKQVLSSEEQERYNDLIKEIKDEYPEIVNYYNEMTGELQIQTDLWEQILKSSKQLAKEKALESFITTSTIYDKEIEVANLEKENRNKDIKKLNNLNFTSDSSISEIRMMLENDAWTLGFALQKINKEEVEKIASYFGVDNLENLDKEGWIDLLYKIDDPGHEGWRAANGYIEDEIKKNEKQTEIEIKEFEGLKEAALATALTTLTDAQEEIVNFVISEAADSEIKGKHLGKIGKSGFGNNLLAYSDLTTEQREILGYAGYEAETYEKKRKAKKDIEKLQEDYKYAAEAYYKSKEGQELIEALNPLQRLTITDFAEKLPTYTKADLDGQIGQTFLKTFAGTENEDNAKTYIEEQVKNWDTIFFGVLQENGTRKNGLYQYLYPDMNGPISFEDNRSKENSKKFFENWTTEQLTIFKNTIDTMPETLREEYGKALEGFIRDKNLTAQESSFLLGINLENLDVLSLKKFKEQYIDSMEDIGKTTKLAEQIWKDFINTVAGYGSNLAITSTVGIKQLSTDLAELRKDASENWKDIIGAYEEQIEKGFISSESINFLLEKGFEDTIKYGIEGIQLDSGKILEAYFDSMAVGGEAFREQIKMNEERLKNDKARTVVLKENIERLQAEKSLNEEQNKELNQYRVELKELELQITNTIAATEFARESLGKEELLDINAIAAALEEIKDTTEDIVDDIDKAKDKYEKAKEELEDLNKKLKEAEKELHEAQYGSEDFTSGLDRLINYTARLENLNSQLELTKEQLEEIETISSSKQLFSSLNTSYQNKTAHISAENKVLDSALLNIRNTLEQSYGNYISFDENGLATINFAYQEMARNDEIRKAFETEYGLYEEYRKKKQENLKEIKEIEKEREEFYKENLDNFITVQNGLIDILKEKAEEEIDITKDKYDALEEEDNRYLDALEAAIEKQRELRDREKSYEELATKEKKLALLQRDTSGSRRKDIQSLEKEVEESRTEILDEEVDSIIDSLKELYEKQKEARDAEIEYMEEVSEQTQYFAKWAEDIMSSWTSFEDMKNWYTQNDPVAQDMTSAQSQKYIDDLKNQYNDLINYMGLQQTNFTFNQQDLADATEQIYNELINNAENAGTQILADAERKANELIEKALEGRDEALEALREGEKEVDEAYKDWQEKEKELAKSRVNSADATAVALERLVEYAKESTIMAAQNSIKIMLDMGYSSNDLTKTYGISKDLVDATIAGKSLTQAYKVFIAQTANSQPSAIGKTFGSKDAAQAFLEAYKNKNKSYGGYVKETVDNSTVSERNSSKFAHGIIWSDGSISEYSTYQQVLDEIEKLKKAKVAKPGLDTLRLLDVKQDKFIAYKNGGLVDYTGPAWVDGTPNKPEAFLNSEDTARIGAAAKLLSNLPIFKSNFDKGNMSTNIGDTSIEIHINVDKITSDYDIDNMVERVKKDIVDVSKSIGRTIILN